MAIRQLSARMRLGAAARRDWRPMWQTLPWLGAALSIASIAVLVRASDFGSTVSALRTANFAELSLAMLASVLVLVCKTVRWQSLYPPDARPDVRLALAALSIGQAMNWALPFRAGDAVRLAVVQGKQHARSWSQTSGSLAIGITVLVCEKLLDGLALLGTSCVLVLLIGPPDWLNNHILVAIALAAAIGSAITWGVHEQRIRLPHPAWLNSTLVAVQHTLQLWMGPSWAASMAGWSAGAWVLGGTVNALVIAAIGPTPSAWLAASLALLVALYGAAVLPSLPGRVGIFQSVCVVVLLPFGIPLDAALACALALYVVVYAPPVLVSGVSLLLVRTAPPRP